MDRIKIRITPSKISYEVNGVLGSSCISASEWIDTIFGKKNIVSDDKTNEYFSDEIEVENIHAR